MGERRCVPRSRRRWTCAAAARTLVLAALLCAAGVGAPAGAAIAGAAAAKLVDAPCYTELDPATATEMQCNGKGLTGPIPPELGDFTGLTKLWLQDNQLTGAVPPEFGALAALNTLYASNNRLTALPSTFSNLQNLEKLYLYNNTLSGNAVLGSLATLSPANLTYLDLGRNDLTGTIPPGIGALQALTWLRLAANQLTGQIPASFGKLTAVTYFHVGDQQGLSGCVPSCIGVCDNPPMYYTGAAPSRPSWRRSQPTSRCRR